VSRFLLCKHIVRSYHPLTNRFFRSVSRHRTFPIWRDPSFQPLSAPLPADLPCATSRFDFQWSPMDGDEDDAGDQDVDEDELVASNAEKKAIIAQQVDDLAMLFERTLARARGQQQFNEARWFDGLSASVAALERFDRDHEGVDTALARVGGSRLKTWRQKGRTMFYHSVKSLRAAIIPS
jgi:hypothetical protein